MKRILCVALAAVMLIGMFTLNVSAAAVAKSVELEAGESMTFSSVGADIVSSVSSAPKVAKVKGNTVTALTKGEASVTANLSNGKTLVYNITVTTNPKLIGVKKKVQKYYTFTVAVKGAATKVKYSSSKPKVASVSEDGEITSLKEGKTKISAKVNGITLSFNLEVYVKEIVSNYKATFKKGSTYSLYYSEVGKNPKIVSSKPKIVKVTKSGKLKALKRGKATVTFSKKNVKAIVKVTVV